MATSRKVLAKVITFDQDDIAAVGYIVKLWGDGRLTAEYRSRWKGSESGTRYELKYDFEEAPANGWKQWLLGFVNSDGVFTKPQDDEYLGRDGWKRIRNGYYVN